MKRKLLKIAITILTLLVLILPSSHVMADVCYVLSLWTESDSPNDLTVSDNGIEIDTMDWSSSSRVYYDFGAGYWNDDFYFTFDTVCDWSQTNGGMYGLIHLANVVDGGRDYTSSSGAKTPNVGLYMSISAGYQPQFIFNEITSGGTLYNNVGYTGSKGTRYYIMFWRDESYEPYGKLFLRVYSDAGYTNLLATSDFTLHEKQDFRYIVTAVGRDYSSGYSVTGDIYNICSYDSLAYSPTVETFDTATVSYLQDTGYYKVQMTGNLTDNGGGGCTTYFYYTSDGITYDSIATTTNADGYTFNGTAYFSILERGTEYDFQAVAVNGAGSDNGTEYSFIIEADTATIPTVYTIPIVDTSETIGSNTTVYGTIWYDGTENCTGTFYYSWSGGNWTQGSSTTDLQTLDSFSYTITGIPEDTFIYYRASANNSQGTANGSISSFIWENATTPDCETLTPQNVDTNSATFTGEITDDGGAECIVAFDYRKQGLSTWNTIYITSNTYTTGDNFTYTINGLSEHTTYEYRAKVSNQCLFNPVTNEYTYVNGEPVAFSTDSGLNVPQIYLNSVAYWDDYTITANGTLTNDGGFDCKVNIKYRTPYGSWQDSGTSDITGVVTGESITTYVSGLEYGRKYEFMLVADNTVLIGDDFLGGIGYSNVVAFTLLTDDDTTTPTETGEAVGEWLEQYNLNNTGGRLLVIIIAMVVVFLIIVLLPANHYQEYIKFTIPIAGVIDSVILVFGMMIGYVPPIVTGVILVLFAIVGASIVIKIFTGNSGGIE